MTPVAHAQDAQKLQAASDTATEQTTTGPTILDMLNVSLTSILGGTSSADTGTTVLGETEFGLRTSGNSDANSFLRALPNVQYQDDTDTDAGETTQSAIDTRPLEVSISGGRVYDNLFLVNGLNVTTTTGTQEFTTDTFDDGTAVLNAESIFGLHSQSIFVPSEFVDSATVIDSNASAKYGNFQGGVVSYDLQQPNTERYSGSASFSVQTDKLVNYNLATPDGENPEGVSPPEFTKLKSAFSFTGPINETFAFLAQYSRVDAFTHKRKDAAMLGEKVDESSLNQFFRLQLDANTEIGKFSLEGMMTDYSQTFSPTRWKDLTLDVKTQTEVLRLKHEYDFGTVSPFFGTINSLSLESSASLKINDTKNETGEDVGYAWRPGSSNESWCLKISNSTRCYEGSNVGDKEQGQTDLTLAQELSGEIWAGTFLAGYDYSYTDANRSRLRDVTYYTATTASTSTTCETSEACIDGEQYAISKALYPAYDVNAHLNSINAYLEMDQTIGIVTVRPGLRLQWDDYQRNFNLAPRLAATVKPFEWLEVTGGFNRYYSASSLAYAIRDGVPRTEIYTRKGPTVTDGWTAGNSTIWDMNASGLDTPYSDEFTGGLKVNEPLLGGELRVRYLNRKGRDQYASESAGSNTRVLTNSASSSYQSASVEYAKQWSPEGIKFLDHLGLTGSLTWAKQDTTATAYDIDADDADDELYYNGTIYTQGSFRAVTGNMDIPLRAQLSLGSSWMEGRLLLGATANYNFSYEGVTQDGSITIDSQSYDFYRDKTFSPTLTVDLNASFEVARFENDRAITLTADVGNVFNSLGNASAGDDNPFVKGRSFWLGMKATF
ncbi:Outer membrane receptor proteins, mostly Fe transport [Roseibium suaedae]|uniref:Outer membrane receptor proteins, mostly Fe transport n=2 Tax=Roseibium suaedae TaxID=735517 RepID=A0A1M7G291_9HYPH|nr:Outer membrane receptor proteins, mostly Fe transport [Roseibium suaedae]